MDKLNSKERLILSAIEYYHSIGKSLEYIQADLTKYVEGRTASRDRKTIAVLYRTFISDFDKTNLKSNGKVQEK